VRSKRCLVTKMCLAMRRDLGTGALSCLASRHHHADRLELPIVGWSVMQSLLTAGQAYASCHIILGSKSGQRPGTESSVRDLSENVVCEGVFTKGSEHPAHDWVGIGEKYTCDSFKLM